MHLEHEKDAERLRQAALLLEAENARLVRMVLELQKEIATLKGLGAEALQQRMEELERQLENARKELFGPSSEKKATPPPSPPFEKKTKKGHGPLCRWWSASTSSMPRTSSAPPAEAR